MSSAPQPPAPPSGPSRWWRWARAVRWYLRELTGESDWERYLERHAAIHPGDRPLTRREFERRRWTDKANNPGNRCC